MVTVGLSGGIGSGKTVISRIFHTLGVPVFYADNTAKELYDSNKDLRRSLINLLGERIYHNGVLQREIMASLIFSDKTLLQQINTLIHPLVLHEFEKWIKCQSAPYVIQEAAILFESGMAGKMTFSIAVSAPETLRITRVMQRDHSTKENIKKRITQQWSDKQRNAKADFVIINNNKQALLPQVIAIHEIILKKI